MFAASCVKRDWIRWWSACWVLLAAAAISRPAPAADEAFVGVLALAADEEGVRVLGLSEETRAALAKLIERREGEAVRVVLDARELPAAEKAARLAEFVAESERQGRALLTVSQREKLEQIRLARAGMLTLGEADVAKVLGLSDDQKSAVQQLLKKRAEELAAGGGEQRDLARRKYEHELAGVLQPEQRATWRRMAGLGGPAGQPARPDGDKAAATPAPPAAGADQKAPAVAVDAASQKVAPAVAGAAPAGDAAPQKTDSVAAGAGPGRDREVGAADGDIKLRFSFHFTPWKDVLEWLSEQANLSLQVERSPDRYVQLHGHTRLHAG